MDTSVLFDAELWHRMIMPLVRLLITMSIGLLVANLIEALHWTRFIAKVASPLAKLAHLQAISGASFSLAFFSPAAANTLLAESYEKGQMSRRELVLANLFNSSPTYLVHLPTLFSMVYAFLGVQALVYVGLTFMAATFRTVVTVIVGRVLLPAPQESNTANPLDASEGKSWQSVVATTLKRFKKRIGKLFSFTIPCYLAVYLMQKVGWFGIAEQFMVDHLQGISFIRPEAFGIIALHLAAESGVALSAAASLAHTGALSMPEIIMALLVGNIVSSPMRAFRHQYPSYSGYFAPSMAFVLVLMNQICRILSLATVAIAYYFVMLQ